MMSGPLSVLSVFFAAGELGLQIIQTVTVQIVTVVEKDMKYVNWLVAVLFVVLSASGMALAHKVNLFAYAGKGTVFTESYFSDGRAVEKEGCWFMTAKTFCFWKGRPIQRGFLTLASRRSMS